MAASKPPFNLQCPYSVRNCKKAIRPPPQLPAYKQLDLREVTSLRPRDNFFPQWDPIGNAESDEKSHK